MPEGHTLHRLARDVGTMFGGRRVTSTSPQGRFGEGAARVDGRILERVDAHGKHLFVEFAGLAECVHIHLGLYGSFVLSAGAPGPAVGAIRWRLATPSGCADLRGPTKCRLVTPGEVDAVIARLGPDPLRTDADPGAAWRRIARSRSPIGALLMDQQVVSGVGNVYRAEVLFRARIDPLMHGRFLRRSEWDAIWRDLADLMAYGVEHGRIDTVRPAHEPEAMGRPPRQDDHGGEVYVYRRAGGACLVCGGSVRVRRLGGRNLFWCPACQKRSRRRVPPRAARV